MLASVYVVDTFFDMTYALSFYFRSILFSAAFDSKPGSCALQLLSSYFLLGYPFFTILFSVLLLAFYFVYIAIYALHFFYFFPGIFPFSISLLYYSVFFLFSFFIQKIYISSVWSFFVLGETGSADQIVVSYEACDALDASLGNAFPDSAVIL